MKLEALTTELFLNIDPENQFSILVANPNSIKSFPLGTINVKTLTFVPSNIVWAKARQVGASTLTLASYQLNNSNSPLLLEIKTILTQITFPPTFLYKKSFTLQEFYET